jgi:hypothetical protein
MGQTLLWQAKQKRIMCICSSNPQNVTPHTLVSNGFLLYLQSLVFHAQGHSMHENRHGDENDNPVHYSELLFWPH